MSHNVDVTFGQANAVPSVIGTWQYCSQLPCPKMGRGINLASRVRIAKLRIGQEEENLRGSRTATVGSSSLTPARWATAMACTYFDSNLSPGFSLARRGLVLLQEYPDGCTQHLPTTQQSAQETEPESHQMSPGLGQQYSLNHETKQPSLPLEKLANCFQHSCDAVLLVLTLGASVHQSWLQGEELPQGVPALLVRGERMHHRGGFLC